MARKPNYSLEKLQREKRKAEKQAEKTKRRRLGVGSSDERYKSRFENP